jgi:outer membrane protein assembly factor BamA
LVLEDRIQFGWPSWRTLGLGATLFADAGQVWKGDAPYGADTDWVGSVGFGLRIALPAESRTIWRPEIVFPVGHDGSPIFRVTFEVNRIRFSGGTSRMGDARRFRRGIEAY